MDQEQLDCTVTIELTFEVAAEYADECFAAELKFASSDHQTLDFGHPILVTKC